MTFPRFISLQRAILAAIALHALWPQAFAQTMLIDPLKARYLEGFLEFVHWEGDPPEESVLIGVVGAPEVLDLLEMTAELDGDGRRIQASNVAPGDDLSAFHAIYVGEGQEKNWEALLNDPQGGGILFLGEGDGFLEAGGGIAFVLRKNRLRFKISVANIEQRGLRVSSKLVEVAVE